MYVFVCVELYMYVNACFVHLFSMCVCVYACVCVCVCVLCVFVCVSLQEENPYSTVKYDQNELDHRYCVLKLHVPYSDLFQTPDPTNTGWDLSPVTSRQPNTHTVVTT